MLLIESKDSYLDSIAASCGPPGPGCGNCGMGAIRPAAPFFLAGSLRLRMLEMEKLVKPLDPVVALLPPPPPLPAPLLPLLSLLLALRLAAATAAAVAAAAAAAQVLL